MRRGNAVAAIGMPWQAVTKTTEVHAPALSVAVLHSEVELVHSPGHDVTTLLASQPQWNLEVFSERAFVSVLKQASRFDCVVLGLNALYQSEIIRSALTADPPGTNVLALHQESQECFEFLPGDARVRLIDWPSDGETALFLPPERKTDEEILLNWPKRIEPQDDGSLLQAPVNRGFELDPATPWRVVLYARRDEDRVPMVLRMTNAAEHRIVLCAPRLAPTRDGHQRLLTNLVSYCAAGIPDVAVVRAGGGTTDSKLVDANRTLAWKMRLQGRRTLELRLPCDEPLPLGSWPLRATRFVVLPEDWNTPAVLADDGAESWMRGGGILVSERPGGHAVMHAADQDVMWVVQRWAFWFSAVEPSQWLLRIHRSRSVLRTLRRLRESRADLQRFGLPSDLEPYKEPLADLIECRLGGGANPDTTISTTAAALDINELLGGHLFATARLRGWLVKRFMDASVEDQFDIARCLGPADGLELFDEAIDRVQRQPLSALAQTRLRQAAVACGASLSQLPAPDQCVVNAGVVLDDLSGSALLAAEYLDAFMRFAAVPEYETHTLAEASDALDEALSTLTRFGMLMHVQQETPRSDQAEQISTEARALLSYFASSAGTPLLGPALSGGVPQGAFRSVLREAGRARTAEVQALREVQPLRTARRMLAWLALLLAAISALGAGLLKVFNVVDLLPAGIALTTVFIVVFILIASALIRRELFPEDDWIRRFAEAVAAGFAATRQRLVAAGSPAGAAQRDKDE